MTIDSIFNAYVCNALKLHVCKGKPQTQTKTTPWAQAHRVGERRDSGKSSNMYVVSLLYWPWGTSVQPEVMEYIWSKRPRWVATSPHDSTKTDWRGSVNAQPQPWTSPPRGDAQLQRRTSYLSDNVAIMSLDVFKSKSKVGLVCLGSFIFIGIR